jgi:hypothetical protein
MSTINTNPINVNYPVPGVNNNSQGFRDNFASIVTNLNIAATELTDLQNKAVVKQALTGTVVNNDMANTLISNASTRSFRATTYNLGNALAGTVLVDASLADVHYGTVASNTTINFGSWPPTGTQSNIQVRLSVSNANAVITFSGNLVASNNTGATTLENFVSNGGVVTVTAPAGVSEMDYIISTTDCGNTLYIEPINRPRQATQIQQRLITPKGFQGDVNGDVAIGPSFNQLTITGANTDPYLTTGNTSQLYTDLPIVFTGTSLAGNIVVGTTYYVRNVVSTTKFTVSSTIGGANIAIGANATGTTMFASPISYVYVATDSYDSTAYPKNVVSTGGGSNVYISNTTISTDVLTTVSTGTLIANLPITFSGTTFGNISANTTYYVRNVVNGTTFTVSSTPGGGNVTLTTGSGNMTAVPQYVSLNSTSGLVVNSPIIFDANIGGVSNVGGLYSNTVYYIKSIVDGSNITISQSRTNGVADSNVVIMGANSTATTANIYVGNDIWKRIPLTSW